ncbi:MAG TPA: phenylacetic acid degradation operon negative regulatory protein PaaX [Candidatus Dormibacteraeota bacterium]|nr:phenylacetic acid degradation operon negative regulatory protein PaaX [Candidatus Dormibacteraeota bacterium]
MPHHAPVPLPAPLRALLRSFRARRPLRGGSLLITVFGDAIAARGGAVTLGSLIRLAAPFGLTERLVRTSVARLARAGWLSAQRSGRRSEYRLTRGGARRFAEATRRIYGASPENWDRSWTLALVPPGQRRLREELEWLGFGQLNGSLLAHPGYSPEQVRRWLRRSPAAGTLLLLRGSSSELGADRRLAERGWDLKELAQRYRRFVRAFAPVEAALARGAVAPATAFLVRTLLIHEYRRIHLRDPLLPPPLLPPHWVGNSAYQLCRRLYARVFAQAEEHLSGSAHRLHRALPPAANAVYARFGGVAP